MHRTQWNALVKTHQPSAIFDRQGQQIQVSDLAVAVNVRVVKVLGIEQADVVCPHLVNG